MKKFLYKKKYFYIGNCIGYDSLNLYKNNLQNFKKGIKYIFVGRLVPNKKIIKLINWFSKYSDKDDYLTIVGDGSEKANITNRLKSSVISKKLKFMELCMKKSYKNL